MALISTAEPPRPGWRTHNRIRHRAARHIRRTAGRCRFRSGLAPRALRPLRRAGSHSNRRVLRAVLLAVPPPGCPKRRPIRRVNRTRHLRCRAAPGPNARGDCNPRPPRFDHRRSRLGQPPLRSTRATQQAMSGGRSRRVRASWLSAGVHAIFDVEILRASAVSCRVVIEAVLRNAKFVDPRFIVRPPVVSLRSSPEGWDVDAEAW